VHNEESACLAKIQAAQTDGFKVHGIFLLPGRVWWNEYCPHLYVALSEAAAARVPFELKRLRGELARFKRRPQGYGSAYFVL
jgi:hypothetical protein